MSAAAIAKLDDAIRKVALEAGVTPVEGLRATDVDHDERGGVIAVVFTDAEKNTTRIHCNRLIVAEEGWPTCSIASEVMAICMEEGFDLLDAPVLRVTDEDVPLPYAANLEKLALIDTARIVAAARKVCYRN